MLKVSTGIVLATAGLALFPFTCEAAEQDTRMVATLEASATPRIETAAKDSDAITQIETRILPVPKPQADAFIVRDEDGNVFYNHVVRQDELTDLSDDIEVVDTYTFSHEGDVYKNKIVEFEED